ncbi:protein kinase, putative [Phytophthora infestans T30-4]|uniref:Protein kinase, putative n=1 Tax=Phytophthora infestans (strain T30-4) TaxID=403677 RepID=D0NDN3_PHYIT|nr:protein kinase, putative [Phytophthora infestans T30-4]EEY56190.1 protein kinase, putative [Phytophthora infestans T30-4]|eukprot:XP_002903020.1 protein kinase, putative [Phytophthora infestans T30-4]
MSSRRPSSRVTSQSQHSNGKMRIKAKRRFLLKVTPIEAWDLLPAESGRARNSYCTLVLLDENKREIKGEKQRTPPMRNSNPVWSPLKAAVLRSLESSVESHQPLGIGAAAASEEYTFGIQTNLMNAKYVLVKCKDKGRVENDDLGRLLLSLEDMNTSGEERVAWYDLQLRPSSKMKRVQGKVRISSRIVREPSLWQLWTAAEQMRQELPAKDRSLYLKPHPNVITGKEAVEWMLCHGLNRPMQGGVTCSTAEEALLLGTALLRNGVMLHVSGDRRFTNSTWKYYRFTVNHLDSVVQQEAIRQRDMILSGEAEEVEDTEEEVLTRSMMAASVSNEEEYGLGASRVARGSGATAPAPAGDSNKGKSKSTIKIEDFELLKVLGTGTYGRVLSARGPDGNVYAIKIITKIGMDDNMRRNAKIERDMLREVRHPFVASLLFAFQNEDKVYMGMEFYNGGDLRHHFTMNQNDELKLTAGRIKLYAAELVAGLAHLHSLDIIYRDLKPENILIQKDGHIVLVDFGLSTYARDENDKKAHSLAGSPEYISPEVLAAANPKKGEPPATYDNTCDWWSLGILIFEMYVGRTPFKDDNKAIMYRNIAEGFLYIPPELPEDVQSLLAGLIERDPSKRLGANEAVPFSIMKHSFFEGIDWEALQQKKIDPEWVPDVIDDADAKYVDNEFINQVPVDTPEWRMLDSVDREREYFEDFTYRATRVIQK